MVTQSVLDRDSELDRLQGLVEDALRQARQRGADAAEISANTSQGLSVAVRLGEVETLEHMQDRGVSVTVFLGRQKGHASSADLRSDSIRKCVDRALDIARYTQEDPASGLAEPEWLATEFPDLDLWHPEVMDATAAIDRALECENAGTEMHGIRNSEGAAFNAGLGLSVYGNTHGFIGRSAGTRYSQSCVLLAGEGDGMQRDYSYDSRRAFADLEAAADTGREAARKTLARINARPVPTESLPILFAPEVAKGLLGHLVGAVSGSSLYRNASFLKDRAGEKLFPSWLNIIEQPHLLRGAGSSSFDNDGVGTRDRELVSDGVLNGYVLSCYSARRLGLETTANAGGVRNLLLEPGRGGDKEATSELHKELKRGLLVTEVMGQGVSLVTGDYSRGATGFLIENGEIAAPVEEVTIAGNLADMFASIVASGADVDDRANLRSGSVLIDRMMVAGS